ncbi:transposase [Chryseobacterium sp. 6424]|nr:transposase [Chryseobacterium sp. 6424]
MNESRYKNSFDFNGIFHVYTHVNGNELVFREEKNYVFFLEKLKSYLLPVLDIYAYCLMQNHIHLLVVFKTKYEVSKNLNIETADMDGEKSHQMLMKPFSNLLNSYAKAYNKMYGRRGALFLDYLKRIRIDDEQYLLNTFKYIHRNPISHGFVRDASEWKFSSYRSYLHPETASAVTRDFMLKYFDSTDDFIQFHKNPEPEP